jgi:hypothetical protein
MAALCVAAFPVIRLLQRALSSISATAVVPVASTDGSISSGDRDRLERKGPQDEADGK